MLPKLIITAEIRIYLTSYIYIRVHNLDNMSIENIAKKLVTIFVALCKKWRTLYKAMSINTKPFRSLDWMLYKLRSSAGCLAVAAVPVRGETREFCLGWRFRNCTADSTLPPAAAARWAQHGPPGLSQLQLESGLGAERSSCCDRLQWTPEPRHTRHHGDSDLTLRSGPP